MLNARDIKSVTKRELLYGTETWDGILIQHKGFKIHFEFRYVCGSYSYGATILKEGCELAYCEETSVTKLKKLLSKKIRELLNESL